MQRSSSGGGGPSTHRDEHTKGRVVTLDSWKSKKKQEQRRVERKRRWRSGSTLRTFAWLMLVLEILAAIASCIPSRYAMHSIIAALLFGVFASMAGLWLNVRMDKIANKVLAWSVLGMLLSLAAGLVRMTV